MPYDELRQAAYIPLNNRELRQVFGDRAADVKSDIDHTANPNLVLNGALDKVLVEPYDVE